MRHPSIQCLEQAGSREYRTKGRLPGSKYLALQTAPSASAYPDDPAVALIWKEDLSALILCLAEPKRLLHVSKALRYPHFVSHSSLIHTADGPTALHPWQPARS